jgi:hypothetical protein
MPLTLIEQAQILQTDIGPTEATLEELVEQAAIANMLDFTQNYKDGTGNPDALNYIRKYDNLSTTIFNARPPVKVVLSKMIVALYAPTGDYATLSTASDAGWASFIESNMTTIIEQYAKITQIEKTAYDSLV